MTISSAPNLAAKLTASTANAPEFRPPTAGGADPVADAKALKKAFSQFVGEAFYGTLLKSVRESESKPAYFHGGTAEDMFQGRLDQEMATQMSSGRGSDFASSLFANQFPAEAALLSDAQSNRQSDPFEALQALRRP